MIDRRKTKSCDATLRTLCLLICAIAVPVGSARAEEGASPPSADAAARRTGDPYELGGKRIVFTDWHFVRPGSYAWKDKEGRIVTADRTAHLGPWEADFEGRDVPHGIRIVAQPAQKIRPTMQVAPQFKDANTTISTIINDGGKYRLWGNYTYKDTNLPFYLESADGMTWSAPNLGLVEYEGSKDNNLINLGPSTVFKDESAPDAERFKGITLETISRAELEKFKQERPDGWEHRADRGEDHIYAIRGFVSPDGLNWTKLPQPLAVEHSDTTNITIYYDSDLKKYVLYTRSYDVGLQSKNAPENTSFMSWLGDAPGAGRRAIGRSESDDFRTFPISQPIIVPGPDMAPSEQIYTNCRTEIPGAPDQHLMFPTIWDVNGDTTKVVMATSYDGKLWKQIPNGNVLNMGEEGAWDEGCIFAIPNLVELADGSFALPYVGYNVRHKYPRGNQWKYNAGFATWPKGRIVALEAPDKGGFTTVGLMPPGRKLLINADTDRNGEILVEVADLNGTPLKGHTFDDVQPIRGDQYRTAITWQGSDDLGFEEGQPIVLRFKMNQARIFALDLE